MNHRIKLGWMKWQSASGIEYGVISQVLLFSHKLFYGKGNFDWGGTDLWKGLSEGDLASMIS